MNNRRGLFCVLSGQRPLKASPQQQLRDLARRLAAVQQDLSRLPLYGIPFAVKDNIDVAGLVTTAACPAFAYQPTQDATVVARLKAEYDAARARLKL